MPFKFKRITKGDRGISAKEFNRFLESLEKQMRMSFADGLNVSDGPGGAIAYDASDPKDGLQFYVSDWVERDFGVGEIPPHAVMTLGSGGTSPGTLDIEGEDGEPIWRMSRPGYADLYEYPWQLYLNGDRPAKEFRIAPTRCYPLDDTPRWVIMDDSITVAAQLPAIGDLIGVAPFGSDPNRWAAHRWLPGMICMGGRKSFKWNGKTRWAVYAVKDHRPTMTVKAKENWFAGPAFSQLPYVVCAVTNGFGGGTLKFGPSNKEWLVTVLLPISQPGDFSNPADYNSMANVVQDDDLLVHFASLNQNVHAFAAHSGSYLDAPIGTVRTVYHNVASSYTPPKGWAVMNGTDNGFSVGTYRKASGIDMRSVIPKGAATPDSNGTIGAIEDGTGQATVEIIYIERIDNSVASPTTPTQPPF